MRKILFFILLILIPVFYFLCGFKKDIKPFLEKSIKDTEPNDTFNTANEVVSQELIIGFFNNKNKFTDKDYYKVNFSVRGVSYKIVQTGVPAIDGKVTIFSPDRTKIHSVDSGRKGEAEKIWEFYPVTNFIYMLVESKASYNEKVPYIIEFIPLVDESAFEEEPNNDKKSAIEIKVGDEKKGLISPEGDVDFYKVVFPENESSDFTVELETFSNHDFGFMIINDMNDKVKFINNYGWGEKESFPFLSGTKGRYYIKVFMNLNSNDNSSPTYNLKIKKSETLLNGDKNGNIIFERELNDSRENATELVKGKTVYGTLFPANDEDWYKFDTGFFAKNISLILSRIRNINTKIEIYNSNMSLVKTVDNGRTDEQEEILLTNLDRGNYYIKITGDDKSLVVYKLYFTTQ